MPKRSRQTQIPRGNSGRRIKSTGGVSHGKHNSTDKRVTKKAARQSDARVLESLEEAARERRELDERLAREAAQTSSLTQPALQPQVKGHSRCTPEHCTWYQPDCPQSAKPEPIQSVQQPTPDPVAAQLRCPDWPRDRKGDKGYTQGEARAMLRQGYHVSAVMKRTGWGFGSFDDLIDQDGWGISTDEWLEKQDAQGR